MFKYHNPLDFLSWLQSNRFLKQFKIFRLRLNEKKMRFVLTEITKNSHFREPKKGVAFWESVTIWVMCDYLGN